MSQLPSRPGIPSQIWVDSILARKDFRIILILTFCWNDRPFSRWMACQSRKNTSVINDIRNNLFPLTWASSKALILCILTLCHVKFLPQLQGHFLSQLLAMSDVVRHEHTMVCINLSSFGCFTWKMFAFVFFSVLFSLVSVRKRWWHFNQSMITVEGVVRQCCQAAVNQTWSNHSHTQPQWSRVAEVLRDYLVIIIPMDFFMLQRNIFTGFKANVKERGFRG